jgi:uncharacterized protein
VDVTPLIPAGRQVINGYGDLGFTITQVRWEGSVIIFPDRTLAWPVRAFDDVTEAALAPIIEAKPELLLLGCGKSMVPAPNALRFALKAHGIKLDCMDTGAACRTYNVLMGEDRSVAAALIAV